MVWINNQFLHGSLKLYVINMDFSLILDIKERRWKKNVSDFSRGLRQKWDLSGSKSCLDNSVNKANKPL